MWMYRYLRAGAGCRGGGGFAAGDGGELLPPVPFLAPWCSSLLWAGANLGEIIAYLANKTVIKLPPSPPPPSVCSRWSPCTPRAGLSGCWELLLELALLKG